MRALQSAACLSCGQIQKCPVPLAVVCLQCCTCHHPGSCQQGKPGASSGLQLNCSTWLPVKSESTDPYFNSWCTFGFISDWSPNCQVIPGQKQPVEGLQPKVASQIWLPVDSVNPQKCGLRVLCGPRACDWLLSAPDHGRKIYTAPST